MANEKTITMNKSLVNDLESAIKDLESIDLESIDGVTSADKKRKALATMKIMHISNHIQAQGLIPSDNIKADIPRPEPTPVPVKFTTPTTSTLRYVITGKTAELIDNLSLDIHELVRKVKNGELSFNMIESRVVGLSQDAKQIAKAIRGDTAESGMPTRTPPTISKVSHNTHKVPRPPPAIQAREPIIYTPNGRALIKLTEAIDYITKYEQTGNAKHHAHIRQLIHDADKILELPDRPSGTSHNTKEETPLHTDQIVSRETDKPVSNEELINCLKHVNGSITELVYGLQDLEEQSQGKLKRAKEIQKLLPVVIDTKFVKGDTEKGKNGD